MLRVSGSGFDPKSKVNFGGTPIGVEFDTETLVRVTVPSTLLLSAGSVPLTIVNPSGTISNSKSFRIDPSDEDIDSDVHVKAVAGVQQSQESSSQRVGKFYVDLGLDIPFVFHKGIRYFLEGHLSSVPQQFAFTLAAADSSTGFGQQAENLKVDNLVQSVDFLTGFYWPFWQTASGRISAGPMIEAGITTPISPSEFTSDILVTNDAAKKEFGVTQPYFAVSTLDRERFFFQYYYGLRLTWRYRDTDSWVQPLTIDNTFGGNAAFTGGCLCGPPVWHVNVYIPLPKLTFVNVFGGLIVSEKSGSSSVPNFYQTAPAGTALTDADVQIVAPAVNRDYYRLGVGMDIVHLISLIKKGTTP